MNTSEQNELYAVIEAKKCATKNGWYYRELPSQDKGIDAIIEFLDENHRCINMIGLQVKGGESYFFNESENGYFFSFDENHKVYWESYSLPVVAVLYNPIEEKLLCNVIENPTSTGKRYKIEINKSFDEFLKTDAKSISKIEKYQYNYNYMITQLFFVEKVLNGADVILVSEEWINKSSGRGDIFLEVLDDGKKEVYKWPYWFPFQPYENVFPRLFPWAEFAIVDEYYYDDDLNNYHNNQCSYDSEENKFIPTISFEAYRASLPDIRGVITAGEVARYKLHLSVNKFGKAFYESHRTLTEMSIYNDVEYRKC